MELLYMFSNVKTLNFGQCNFVENVKCDWNRFKDLEYLTIVDCKNTSKSILKSLQKCTKLKLLYITTSFDNYRTMLSDCNKCPVLERLGIELFPPEVFPPVFHRLPRAVRQPGPSLSTSETRARSRNKRPTGSEIAASVPSWRLARPA